jgi:hypothetical protein
MTLPGTVGDVHLGPSGFDGREHDDLVTFGYGYVGGPFDGVGELLEHG